jgi:hypothetical protein
VIGPVPSPLPSRAMHFGCPAIWFEVCLWFFRHRIEPPTPCVDILTRASSLHDRTSGAASEVSRSAPSGSSGCALLPFWFSALLFVGTSSQPPGVSRAALLLVSTTLHCKSEWCPVYCKLDHLPSFTFPRKTSADGMVQSSCSSDQSFRPG